jgi:hypothetical protein
MLSELQPRGLVLLKDTPTSTDGSCILPTSEQLNEYEAYASVAFASKNITAKATVLLIIISQLPFIQKNSINIVLFTFDEYKN